MDVLFIAAIAALFLLSWALAAGCDKLAGRQ
ncbi:MAG: potassium ABC transporter ATPase [Burkholderiaceae bacterium]